MLFSDPSTPARADQSALHDVRLYVLQALVRAWSPSRLRAALRDPEQELPLLGVASEHVAWLRATLLDLERLELLSAAPLPSPDTSEAWASLLPKYGERLVDVLRGQRPARSLFDRDAEEIAELVGASVSVPARLTERLRQVVAHVYRQVGAGCRILDALFAPQGSFVASALAGAGEPSQIVALRGRERSTLDPSQAGATFQAVSANWSFEDVAPAPFHLVAAAGSFDAALDSRRWRALRGWARKDALWLLVAPGDSHPLGRYLLGLLDQHFAWSARRWENVLRELGLQDLQCLAAASGSEPWSAWLGSMSETATTGDANGAAAVAPNRCGDPRAAEAGQPPAAVAALREPEPAAAPPSPAGVARDEGLPPVTRAARKHPASPSPAAADELRARLLHDLAQLVEETLHVPAAELEPDADLTELGMDSILASELAAKLAQAFTIKLAPTIFFTSNTPATLATALLADHGETLEAHYGGDAAAAAPASEEGPPAPPLATTTAPSPQHRPSPPASPSGPAPSPALLAATSPASGRAASPRLGAAAPIAVIGMAGAFPGAASPDELLSNLLQGRETLGELPVERWAHLGWSVRSAAGTTPRAGLMPHAETFDPLHFRISPREAETLDPRQRWMLQWVWHAIESAGYRPSALAGSRTAVFVGVENNEFAEYLDPSDPFFGTSTGPTMIANRISYHFDFHGTSEVVDSACCSSALAIYRAVRALQSGEADLAIAGGVSLLLSPRNTEGGLASGMLSPRGCTRAFDRDADGWVIGEGGGVVLLAPLSRALAADAPVLGVIRGAAANHGGRVSSLTAPNPDRIAEAARAAIEQSGLTPASVSVVEAHGVGGALVDAAEMQGLMRAYQVDGSRHHCQLGSLTPNIGNLDPASTVAGLIKLLLCFEAKELPPQIRFEVPNEHVDLDRSAFRINPERSPWEPRDADGRPMPRRAGLHSYSWGGTNVHFVLEEPPVRDCPVELAGPQLAVLSARTPSLLREQVRRLADYLERDPSASLSRVCATLQLAREMLPARLALLVKDSAELAARLRQWLASERVSRCWSGSLAEGRAKGALVGDTPACLSYMRELFQRRLLEKVAALWVDGANIRWELAYESERPRPLRLPAFAFEARPCPLLPRASARVSAGAPTPRRSELEALLKDYAEQRLDAAALLDRLAPLPDQVEAPAPPPAPGEAWGTRVEAARPGDDARVDLVGLLRQMLETSLRLPAADVGLDADLRDLGVDSLTGMAFMKEVQRRIDAQVPMTLLLEHPSLGAMADTLLRQHAGPVAAALGGRRERAAAWSPLVTIQRGGPRPASFWVHGAIGDVSWLIDIAHQLGPDYPIYGLEPRGLAGGEPHRSVPDMAACYLDAIRAVQPRGPYHLGGYSGGGIVVLEMTRQLHRDGEEVQRMFIGDTFMRGSNYFEDATVRLQAELDLEAVQLTALANVFTGLGGASEVLSYPHLQGLPRDERIAAVARHLAENTNSGRDLEQSRAWVEHNLQASNAMVEALTSYEPKPLEKVNCTSFFSCLHGYISPDSKSQIPLPQPRLDHVDHWRSIAPGSIEVIEVPCDHFELMHRPHVAQVVRHLQASLR